MSPAEEVQECRHKLGLDRTAFAKALGLGPRGYAQVRKWEEGIGEPSAAAMTAIRLRVELEELKRNPLPWMTPEMWDAAQTALHDTQDMLGKANSMAERRALTPLVQLLRALLERRPSKS